MHPTFRFEDGPDDATRVLIPCGELGGDAASDVRHRVADALESGKRRVLVDLSEITFLDTGALATLVDANARVQREGASLFVVIPPDSRIRLVFSITGIDKVLRVLGSRDEALSAA